VVVVGVVVKMLSTKTLDRNILTLQRLRRKNVDPRNAQTKTC